MAMAKDVEIINTNKRQIVIRYWSLELIIRRLQRI